MTDAHHSPEPKRCLALSGGVGGAKLCLGLLNVLGSEQLAVVANTADDFDHLGLRICPDLDTVMYTLTGTSNTETGWGRAGESWNCLEALEQLGGEAWFRLGDRDLATHLFRSQALAEGSSLSQVTSDLCRALDLNEVLIPMSDQPVSTLVRVGEQLLSFQHYFVRDRCQPTVSGFVFEGVDAAEPSPLFCAELERSDLGSVLLGPSNPMVSIDPILAIPGVLPRLQNVRCPVVAVSPIIGGEAVKGPAAKMMRELDMPVSSLGVAQHYADRGFLDGLVIDTVDQSQADGIEKLGIRVLVTETLMISLQDRERLARECLDFADRLSS